MDAKMTTGFWAWIGKIGTLLAVITAAVGLWTKYATDAPRLTLTVDYSTFSLPPSVEEDLQHYFSGVASDDLLKLFPAEARTKAFPNDADAKLFAIHLNSALIDFRLK